MFIQTPLVDWSARCETPEGDSGRLETPQRSEEAQAPPRGKRTPGTKGDKELTQTPIFYTPLKKLLHNLNLSDII